MRDEALFYWGSITSILTYGCSLNWYSWRVDLGQFQLVEILSLYNLTFVLSSTADFPVLWDAAASSFEVARRLLILWSRNCCVYWVPTTKSQPHLSCKYEDLKLRDMTLIFNFLLTWFPLVWECDLHVLYQRWLSVVRYCTLTYGNII